MLVGLLFAIEEAVQPPGRLVATLPFAGTTLIEHQARQLVAAGAGQIVVIGDHRHPDLVGALSRIGRRGVAVDAVGSVADAVETLHPLSRVVMLADGLVAGDATIAAMASEAEESAEALLVVPTADAPSGFERIGGASAWAGIARIGPHRVAEVAALPADYAPQSTLLRVTEAAGAVRTALPPQALADGHGIERAAEAIERRGRQLVAAAVAMRHGWFDRWLGAPLARIAMPFLIGAGVSGAVVTLAALAVALLAVAALFGDWARTGMVLAVTATLGCGLAAALAALREETPFATAAAAGTIGLPYVALLLLGWRIATARADAVPEVLAIVLIALAVLGQRAVGAVRRWWGSAPAYLLVATIAVLAGCPVAGLALAGCYAGATLAAAIDRLRADARRHA